MESSNNKDKQKNKNGDNLASPKIEIITAARPTANLTVANYLGMIAPLVNLQNQGLSPYIFVADLHALTDNEPDLVRHYNREIVSDYLALGVDPDKSVVYLQSDIAGELGILNILLARHISVAELLRVPTLKEKLKNNSRPETANTLLFLYPILMAADILIQRAAQVPIGEDQAAHLELSRLLARRFNDKYGPVFPVPQSSQRELLRILALRGKGKMSKSSPAEDAIFLSDSPEAIAKKIKSAETAFAGEMSDKLNSHLILAKGLSSTKEQKTQLEKIIKEHKRGEAVMGEFKKLFTQIAQEFVANFQNRKIEISNKPEYIDEILEKGKQNAKKNAIETIEMVYKAIYK